MKTCPHCSKQFTTKWPQNMRTQKYCSRACGWAAKRIDEETAFWSKVQKGDGCWPWTAAKHRDGYGRFNLPRHAGMVIAHRHAWKLTNGEIPAGMDVCHTCDNPPCCNPAHLFLGTPVENMQDSFKKGRLSGAIKKMQEGFRRYQEKRRAISPSGEAK